jgi:LmbE family N-acetylglucosaminyl deacetylase
MFKMFPGQQAQPLRRILCLGSHCDDIEIGCGGSLLRLLGENPSIEVMWVVFSSTPVRKREARRAADYFLKSTKKKKIVIRNFPDRFFPSSQMEIKREFDALKKKFDPDLIFTHCRQDLHQDHRVISELTWNTFRNHLILEYEIPKYDADLGAPNVLIGLDRSICEEKSKYVLDAFASQCDKPWFTKDTFLGLARLRGVEANCPGNFAEGFYCRKLVL